MGEWVAQPPSRRGEEPHAWRYGELVVHRLIGCPGEWFCSHRTLGIERRALRATDLEDAQREAVRLAHRRAQEVVAALPPLECETTTAESVRQALRGEILCRTCGGAGVVPAARGGWGVVDQCGDCMSEGVAPEALQPLSEGVRAKLTGWVLGAPAESAPDDPVWHFARSPGVAWCRADYPNMHMTDRRERATCPACREAMGAEP